MIRTWSIVVLLLLLGCSKQFHGEGVGNVLGLKLGVPLDLKIKYGPTDPPDSYGYLKEFYEVDFPNKEFEFVGVAITKNSEKNLKAGLVFSEERLIWGAYFHNHKPCEEKDFLRTKDYLSKNWAITPVREYGSEAGKSPYMKKGTFMSPSVIWKISCTSDLGLDLAVTDYSALRKAGNASTKKNIDKILLNITKAIKEKS
ncbi:MAG: hypothetical protein WAO76_05515 [Georgfuchsia sp.]